MMDKYFAPRTTEGAQPSIKCALVGKESIWRADIAIRSFFFIFYDAHIPTNVVNSFYFKQMLDVVATIGP